jgi:hypothetical protein
MLLAPYYVDGDAYYCQHHNKKNLHDILINPDEYIAPMSCGAYIRVILCDQCSVIALQTDKTFIINNVLYAHYDELDICKMCNNPFDYSNIRFFLLGKYYNIKICDYCFLNKWKNKTCEDCDKTNSNDIFKTICNYCFLTKWKNNSCENCGEKKPIDLFKTICDLCSLAKQKELHLCSHYLDYNTDVTKIILDQLQEIKNYSVIKN